MQKWEYKAVLATTLIEEIGEWVTQKHLNTYGDKGWELVAVDSQGIAYFKRPIIEDENQISYVDNEGKIKPLMERN